MDTKNLKIKTEYKSSELISILAKNFLEKTLIKKSAVSGVVLLFI